MLFSPQTDGCSLFLREDRGPDPVCFLPRSVIVDGTEEEGRLLAHRHACREDERLRQNTFLVFFFRPAHSSPAPNTAEPSPDTLLSAELLLVLAKVTGPREQRSMDAWIGPSGQQGSAQLVSAP